MDSYSAPGLARGIKALQLLNDGSKLTLNELIEQTSIPKSSILRILETLMAFDYIEKDETGKLFQAKIRIISLNAPSWEAKLRQNLSNIAKTTGQTAEWYAPSKAGLTLIQRKEPPGSELQVRAQIGFFRPIGEGCELDAVARAALAALAVRSDATVIPSDLWTYQPDGIRRDINKTEAEQLMFEAKQKGFAAESCYNSNGVKRIACPIKRGDKFIGVLAVAQCYIP